MRTPGELIDASNLRTVDALVAQRYLAPLSADDPATVGSGSGPTPDPKIAQDRMVEQEAGRKGGPSDDVAEDSPVGGRTDGPTLEEYVAAGYKAENYPPDGYAERPSAGLTEYRASQKAKRLKGRLPEDFPGHKALSEAGLDTYAKVRRQLDTLEDLDGIGPKTAESIREQFASEAAGTDDEDEADHGDEVVDAANEDSEPGDSTVPKAPNAGD